MPTLLLLLTLNQPADPAANRLFADGRRWRGVRLLGAPAGAAPAPAAVAQPLDQNRCEFAPRVVIVPAGSSLDILNSDGILHNIHTYSTANPTINKAQPKFKKVMTERFDKPEYVKVTCDVHSWMVGWIAVVPTAYHAISDGSGAAKIGNVPPGKHTVEVWHPTLGKQTKEVEVKAGQTTRVAFDVGKP